MIKKFNKYKHLIQETSKNLLLVTTILFILELINILSVDRFIRLKLLYVIGITFGIIWFVLLLQNLTGKQKELLSNVIKYLFLVTLFLVTISSLKFSWITWLSAPLLNIQFYILTLCISTGIITFWQNKDVNDEIEDEKNNEEKRKKEFDYKFKGLVRFNFKYDVRKNWKEKRYFGALGRAIASPFVWLGRLPYSSMKRCYEEGWLYSAGVIIIFLLYIFIQFSMFQYSGNYSDEYRHMIAGENILETGKFPILSNSYGDQGYVRGAPISILVALFFSIFGASLFVAKLVPIFLGLATLILLNSISKDVISNKKIRFILLLLFVFNSWLIFSHFYIRHHIFLEFSLIFLVYLIIKLNKNISNKSWKNGMYIFLIIFVNCINYFLMHDMLRYIVPFATFFSISYLLLFESHNANINQQHIKKLFHYNFLKKIIIIIIVFIGFILLFSTFYDLNSIINSLFTQETNTSSNHINFNNVFFENYFIFTLYFLTGLFITFTLRSKNRIIYLMIFPLLILHYISNESMQIMRVIVYILPVYFLLVCLGLNKVIKVFQKNKFIVFLILFLFIISSISVLLQDRDIIFKSHPQIPGEVGYQEYKPTFNYINSNLADYVIITADYNAVAGSFYGTKIDYELDFKNILQNHYTHYLDEEGTLKEYYTNIPVINNSEELENIIKEHNVCIILKPYSSNFLEDSDLKKIKNEFRKEKIFIGFDIYCKEHN